MKYIFFVVLSCLTISVSQAQNVLLNGYVFESGNRGYLNQVDINIVDKATGESVGTTQSNEEGFFEIMLAPKQEYIAYATKQLFEKKSFDFDTKKLDSKGKKFIKIKMDREPGYDFEVTLAPKRDNDDIAVDAIRGAWIEVYNNTTEKEILSLKDHPDLEFNVHFEKGNHYTIMVRKEGFFTKRMEAYVNVDGCILCFEGVGSIRPGVVDNLTEGNEMGVLLTNVELDPLFSGKNFEVQNIFYDFGKATLRPESKVALDNLALVLKDNPHIMVELGSHTDSRGTTSDNQKLSESRAKAAVDYLVLKNDISPKSIIAAGYGESRLSNNCKDGVNCSEDDHQKNRRTEITVLNVNDSKRERKTLAEIRIEEEFLRSIMADDNSKTVKAKDVNKEIKNSVKDSPVDEQTPTKTKVIAKERTSGQDIENRGKISISKKEGAVDKQKVIVAEKKTEGEEKKEVVQEVKVLENKVIENNVTKPEVVIAKKEEVVAETKVVKEVVPQKTQADPQADKRISGRKSTITKERIEREKTNKTMPGDSTGVATPRRNLEKQSTYPTVDMSKKVGIQKTDNNTYTLNDYTGYKIVIQFSRYPLNSDHDIFKRHSDVIPYKATSGSTLYLIGDFETEEKAQEFLDTSVTSMYPGAYIISFENGRRLR